MATATLPVGTGTQQWTPPVACQIISKLELWGAGGSGARWNGRRATGGGAGAYKPVTGPITTASLLVAGTIPYQTGRGGAAVAANNVGNPGSAGTWFSAAGTYYADFGRGGQNATSGTVAGGIAGLAANCIPTTGAVSGGVGGTCSSATGASGGGASGSANGAGVTAAAVSTGIAGAGATAPAGGGSGGNASISSGVNAGTGSSPGAGGGAANTAANSGAGADGQIIVTYTPLWPGNVIIGGAGSVVATAVLREAGKATIAGGVVGASPWSSDFSLDFGPLGGIAVVATLHEVAFSTVTAAGVVYTDASVAHQSAGTVWQDNATINGAAVLGVPGIGAGWSNGFSSGYGPVGVSGGVVAFLLAAGVAQPVGIGALASNAIHTPTAGATIAALVNVTSSASHTPIAAVNIGPVLVGYSVTATWIDVDVGPELFFGLGGSSITATHTPSGSSTINGVAGVGTIPTFLLIAGTPSGIAGGVTVYANASGTISANATLNTGATVYANAAFVYQGTASLTAVATVSAPVATIQMVGKSTVAGSVNVGAVVASELVAADVVHIHEATLVTVATALLEAAASISGGVSQVIADSHVVPGATIWNGSSTIAGSIDASTTATQWSVATGVVAGLGGVVAAASHTPAGAGLITALTSVALFDQGILASAKSTVSSVGAVALDSIHAPVGDVTIAGAGSVACSTILFAANAVTITGAATVTTPAVFALGATATLSGTADSATIATQWQSVSSLISGSAIVISSTQYTPAATVTVNGDGGPAVYVLLLDYQSTAIFDGASQVDTTATLISGSFFLAPINGEAFVTVDGAELNTVQIAGMGTVQTRADFIISPWIPVIGDPRFRNDALPWIPGPYRVE